jgi:hypothetical protein
MFAWLKKASQDRVLKTMDGLSYLANLTTAYKINSLLKSSGNYSNDEVLSKVMAVRTNYLFGKDLSDSHSSLDLKNEFNSAIDWLANDSLFRELVVQSLRVMSTTKMVKSGEPTVLGEDVLTIYGYLYPENSSPDNYKILVFKAVDSLDLKSRNDVLNKAKKLGLI